MNQAILTRRISQHWLGIFLVVYGLFNLLPFLAPVLMNSGLDTGGKAIYTAYSPLCHQMAQRSFFLFGQDSMYNTDQLPVTLTGTGDDALTLRHFKGTDELGWKVAWSDRMVYMYGSVWLAAFIYALLRKKLRPLSPIWFAVLLLPMVIDGGTHFLSDLSGIAQGFRYDNAWLASLTGHVFPESFYSGDEFGSFNSLMRLLSGITFGIACVWLAFPYIDRSFQQSTQQMSSRFERLQELEQQLNAEHEKLLSQQKHG